MERSLCGKSRLDNFAFKLNTGIGLILKNKRSSDYPIKSVFIVEPFNEGWIIEMLVRDIASQMRRIGIDVRIGPQESYDNEAVAFHTRGYYFKPLAKAVLNSVLMTHIDDVYKEREMLSIAKKADSVVCMSEHNAEIMCDMGASREKVIGNSLPHRGGNVRRPRVGVFSARYADGRKNEDWLLEYFQKIPRDSRNKLIICLIGYGWEAFGASLAKLDVSFEIYRYDRALPGEYERQKDIVAGLDKLLYMGFDGGSMSIYDGMHANVDMIFSDQCYHRELDPRLSLFSSKDDFFALLDDVVLDVVSKEQFLDARSIEVYTAKLLTHWSELAYPEKYRVISKNQLADLKGYSDQLKVFRANYRQSKLLDAARSFYRFLRRRF